MNICNLEDSVTCIPYTHPTLTLDALRYAELGFRIVPLAPRSKKPIIRGWPKRATRDPQQIISWFETWPEANLGILMGVGLVGLDIDPRNGGQESWKRMIGRRKLPETAEALTGSGGRHYLFRIDPSVKIASKSMMPGIDIKGEGGMLVVEPSIHPDTDREYVWLRTPQQGIADAPGWLLRLLPRQDGVVPVGHRRPLRCIRTGEENALVAKVINRFPVEEAGRRHAAMCRAVGSLIGCEYHPEVVQRVMIGWHDHFYELGRTSMGRQQAFREIADCIRSTLGNPNFLRARSTIDHRARLAETGLSPAQEKMIHDGLINDGILTHAIHEGYTLPCNRVTSPVAKLCKTAQERAFVESLCVYFSYKTNVLNESPPKATRDQIRQVVVDRYGIRLDNRQFERLKAKYITRPGKPASRYDLAVQIREGRQGIPSEYLLTGLIAMMAPGTAVGHPEPVFVAEADYVA